MKLPTIITAAALFVAILASFVFLTAIDKPIEGIVTQLILLVPIVAALLGLQAQTSKIDKQTNGTNAELRARNAALTTEVAQLRSALSPEQAQSIPVTANVQVTEAGD